MKTTLFVAMITYDGVINLLNVKRDNAIGNTILSAKPSNMNKNKDVITSLLLNVKIENVSKATVDLYAPRIKLVCKNSIDVIAEESSIFLKEKELIYAINKKKGEMIITFYSFGHYNSILDIEEELIRHLEPKYESLLKSVQSFYTKAHVKGTKSGEKILELSDKLESIFADERYSKGIKKKNLYFSLTNSCYKLEKHIAIYELASKIRSVKGFEKACVIYDNLHTPGIVTITVPLDKDYGNLWRKDNECTYTVRAMGIITQSTPSIEYQEEAKKLLLGAFKELSPHIYRD